MIKRIAMLALVVVMTLPAVGYAQQNSDSASKTRNVKQSQVKVQSGSLTQTKAGSLVQNTIRQQKDDSGAKKGDTLRYRL